jgi:hypothetical protein
MGPRELTFTLVMRLHKNNGRAIRLTCGSHVPRGDNKRSPHHGTPASFVLQLTAAASLATMVCFPVSVPWPWLRLDILANAGEPRPALEPQRLEAWLYIVASQALMRHKDYLVSGEIDSHRSNMTYWACDRVIRASSRQSV